MKLGSVEKMKVPVQVVLGGVELSYSDISSLGVGSIIELDRMAGEPVDLVASGHTIAKGEVVVIDESFGIRLTKVVEQEP
jgi:flagellar motor switch protein FliN/FliY